MVLRLLLLEAHVMLFKMQISGLHQVRHSGSIFFFFLLALLVLFKETAMASDSSTLAWKIPWVDEPGRLQSMGSLRVRHD